MNCAAADKIQPWGDPWDAFRGLCPLVPERLTLEDLPRNEFRLNPEDRGSL